MIQALIQIISERFNPQHPGKLSAIFTGKGHHGGINQLLSDQRMGGSSSNVSGHGLVLAMHLHRQFGNASTLIQALIDSSSTLVNDVHCVKPLQQLCNRMPKDNAHLIFPPPTRKHGQARILELYQNIWTVLAARELSDEADEGHDNAVQELVDLTKQCCESAETVDFFGTKISLKGAFQMLLWLCIYHNFYDKQKQSSSLANVIGTHLNKLLDCRLCALYRSFVDPSHMIDHPEDPGLDENALQCIHSEDLRFIPLQREEKTCDPILQFFYPLSSPRRDSLDNYNCHGIANLVAAVLACPPRSNHLWYLMFEADELEQTYMSGFMYNKAINNGEGLYDSGIELTSDGQYGRPDYIPRVTRGTLSLHSLYHVLWSNFAALCIGLATQPDAHEKIHGRVISKVQPIRHYCSTQLRTMWLHMTNNMDMTSEEHTFFITRSMTNIIKCFGVRDEHFGRLDTLKQLDHYESLWHTNVFLPSLKDLPEQLAQHCNFSHNALMQKTRELARFYPQFPTLHNFTQRMLSSIDVARNFPLLWKFLIAYPRLQAGGAVLPELIVFYKWVHTVLPYTCPMSLDYARESTFEKIVTDRKLSRLYCRVKDGFNKYIKQVGQSVCFSGCSETKQERKLELLSDETKILYFLSETDDPGESNDAIYLAIADIIDFHNAFLKEAKEVAMKSGLEHYFPEQEIHFINPAEVHQDICIVSRKSTKEDNTDEKVTERFLLDLVRSRLLYPSETSLFGSSTLETEFKCDILHLQEDICRSFLVGKPFIRNLEQFRTNFKFTASKREALELGISTDDLQKHLDERLKVPLRSQQIQELEYGFHSANCQLLVDVTTGIYGVANQLLLKFNPFRVEHLQDMTLPEFIRQTRTKRITMQPEVLVSGLVVHHERLSSVQIDCLNNLKMSSLYSSLELFLEWISDGLYDFNHLPYKMKSNLPNECKELLSTPHLHQIYKGDVAEILSDINSFVTVLIHSETHMARSISDCAQISLIEYLSDSSLCLFGDDRSALVKMILPSVLCRHYVKLRVHLRKIEQELTANIDSEEAGAPSEKWNELVHDLWEEKYLKYLWELAVDFEEVDTFVYDPYTGTYGFEEWDRQSEEDKYITPQETQKVCAITVIDQEITSEPPTVPREQLDTIIQHVAKTIDSDGIGEFLNKYDDLKEYKELFKAQEIDGEILIALTKEELKDMGIPNSWHQTKILLEFKKFCKTKQDTAKTVHE